jgi:hypothetical protein
MKIKAITSAVLSGLLRPMLGEVNVVSAPVVAKERGMVVDEIVRAAQSDYESLITVTVVTETLNIEDAVYLVQKAVKTSILFCLPSTGFCRIDMALSIVPKVYGFRGNAKVVCDSLVKLRVRLFTSELGGGKQAIEQLAKPHLRAHESGAVTLLIGRHIAWGP